jgi:uncharacterized protein
MNKTHQRNRRSQKESRIFAPHLQEELAAQPLHSRRPVDNLLDLYIHFVHNTDMKFEWDPAKELANIAKHGLSFELAKTIWKGPIYTIVDYRYEYGETRFQTTGSLASLVVVLVVHTEDDETIRIISARKATPNERKIYYAEIRARFDR